MYQYMDLIKKLHCRLGSTLSRPDRTNTGTASIFDHTLEFNLKDYFPLLPYREIDWNGIVAELVWFLRGETNIKFLEEHNCKWWSQQCDSEGNVGPMYGAQWRGYTSPDGHVRPDQFAITMRNLISDPYGRRHVIDSWEAAAIPENNCNYDDNVKAGKMAIAPCHHEYQFYVEERNGKQLLSLKFHMRSSDTFLGLPANIASYALLLHIVAGITGYTPYRLIYNGGDVHLYANHDEACSKLIMQYNDMVVAELLRRNRNREHSYTQQFAIAEELCPKYKLPEKFCELVNSSELDFSHPDLVEVLKSGLTDYHPNGKIAARMAR